MSENVGAFMTPLQLKLHLRDIEEFCVKKGFKVYPIIGEVCRWERKGDLGNKDNFIVKTGALWEIRLVLGAKFNPE